MTVIIAGGRYFKGTGKDTQILLDIHKKTPITEVVSGKASGADTFGEEFAEILNIPVKPFPADWHNLDVPICKIKVNKYGYEYNALAGFNRNEEMAKYAQAVILFPGGNGTEDMYRRSLKHKLKILYNGNYF